MRAAVLRDGQMVVRDNLPDPVPTTGQVLVRVRACGICGSDLHFARHGATMLALADEMVALAGLDASPAEVLSSGAAHDAWEAMVAAQGGDLSAGLPVAELVETVTAERGGVVRRPEAGAGGVDGINLPPLTLLTT